ncbi:MAG: hypothetical protein PHS92_05310 [Candidatus Gracilibacteria bacterium]|nr:hypothetical protein [Candidatus Gracilibacteria bacterium]
MTSNSAYIFSKDSEKEPKSMETLMIVDMQGYYLDCSDWPHIHDEFELLKWNVIKNIRSKIEYILDIGGRIILVEYEGHGDTIPEIKSMIPGKPLILKKTSDGLLENRNEYKEIALEKLEKYRDSIIGIGGVSISACVVGSMVTLILDGFNANVLLDCSMNIDAYGYRGTYFYEENSLGTIIKAFSEKDPYVHKIISNSINSVSFSGDKSFVDRLIHPGFDFSNITEADYKKHLWEVGLSH